ncbi:MAG: acetylxylan esterase [Candidatus Hydrogenedentes bacterium]|nr:acetylxylan esterase [Candidatus Hydrogenedentota bacterium]
MRHLLPILCLGVALPALADHLVLQVEDFEGPWRRQTNISGYLGKGFCTSNANPEIASTVMSTTVSIREAGRHVVWARGYTSDNSHRAFQVQVGDRVLSKTHTGTERHWVWERAGEVELAAGPVTVLVKDADDGFESVDAIVLTDRKDYDPIMAEQAEKQWLVYGGDIPERANALDYTIQACCRALAQRPDPAGRKDWEAKAPLLREQLAQALGIHPFPDRTPLNARVTGRAERDSYTIENIVFESRPGFLVTANLYIPKEIQLPGPAVIVVAGHDMENAKNCPTYQMAQLGLVRQGFIVLAHDPIGQGERRVPGFDHKLGYGSLLVGQTNEGYIVWDTLRALDYLVTRPEVDTARIGLSGNSGGGENTFYTMPFDERFAVAGSYCFVCSYEDFIREGGNHCICNHLPGIVHLMEEFEIVGLNAPRPFLAGNGAEDPIFPIDGVRTTLRRATAVYAFYDAEDRIAQVDVPLGHGWAQPLRETAYGWMNRWLQDRGDGSPVPEADYEPNDPKSPDVLCFDGANIPAESETVVTLNRKLAEQFRQTYAEPPERRRQWKKQSRALRDAIWDVFGGRPEPAAPTARSVASFQWDGRRVETLALSTEADMEIAAVLVRPAQGDAPCPAVVYLHDSDKAQLRTDPQMAALLDAGWAVLGIDPRGLGETAVHENHVTSDSICLGRSIFAQRVWDVIQAAEYLAARDDIDSGRIRCYGVGSGGLLALFAAALDAPFEAVAASTPLASYRFFLEDSQPQPISLCVPNILKVADVAQAAALAAPRPLYIHQPLGYGRNPLTADEAGEEFAFPREVYALVDAAGAIEVSAQEDTSPLDAFLTAR